jgi:hypothetical protein
MQIVLLFSTGETDDVEAEKESQKRYIEESQGDPSWCCDFGESARDTVLICQ